MAARKIAKKPAKKAPKKHKAQGAAKTSRDFYGGRGVSVRHDVHDGKHVVTYKRKGRATKTHRGTSAEAADVAFVQYVADAKGV